MILILLRSAIQGWPLSRTRSTIWKRSFKVIFWGDTQAVNEVRL